MLADCATAPPLVILNEGKDLPSEFLAIPGGSSRLRRQDDVTGDYPHRDSHQRQRLEVRWSLADEATLRRGIAGFRPLLVAPVADTVDEVLAHSLGLLPDSGDAACHFPRILGTDCGDLTKVGRLRREDCDDLAKD